MMDGKTRSPAGFDSSTLWNDGGRSIQALQAGAEKLSDADMNRVSLRSIERKATGPVAGEHLVDGKYSIKDLVDIGRLRVLFEEFSKTTGFTTGFVSYPEQEILISTGWRDACTKFHRSTPASAKACRQSNIYLTGCLGNMMELNTKPCANGLVDGATPVVVRGKHVASVSTGQVLFEPPDLEYFKRQAKKFGYEEKSYLKAIRQLPVVTEEQLKQVLRYLSSLAAFIAEEGLNALRINESAELLSEENKLRRESEQFLQKSEDRLNFALQIINTGAWELNLSDYTSTRRTLIHDQIFGYETLLPKWSYDMFLEHVLPEDRPDVDRRIHEALATQSDWSLEYRIRRRDGEVRWVLGAGSHERNPEGKAVRVTGIIQDITERKKTEEKILHANLALRAIDECNSAILQAQNEEKLFQDVCRIIVESGGHPMAFVGLVEHDSRKSVRPVAYAGQGNDFFQKEHITWADTPRGRGVAGTTIRTRKVTVISDFQNRSMAASFVRAANEDGVKSAIGLPLMIGNECIGALSIYSRDMNSFDATEQRTLGRFVENLMNGISVLRARAEQERLQNEISFVGEQMQQKLGQELHDDLGQQITGMALMAAVLEKNLSNTGSPFASDARELLEMLTKTATATRTLAHGLFPLEIDPGGLHLALKNLAAKTSKLPGISCKLKFRPSRRFNPAHRIHLYRIMQEAVNNAIKHGHAREIIIEYSHKNGSHTFTVSNDGVLFKKARQNQGGLGLRLMKYRADVIGATLDVMKGKKGGCRVVCSLKDAGPKNSLIRITPQQGVIPSGARAARQPKANLTNNVRRRLRIKAGTGLRGISCASAFAHGAVSQSLGSSLRSE